VWCLVCALVCVICQWCGVVSGVRAGVRMWCVHVVWFWCLLFPCYPPNPTYLIADTLLSDCTISLFNSPVVV
jgi:hypothetical protein